VFVGQKERRTMAKQKLARTHKVRANVRNLDLTKAGTSINLAVYAKGEKIGTVEIGRGSLRWFGRKKHRGKRISWSKLADWMENA
jgi:hypothetical protein